MYGFLVCGCDCGGFSLRQEFVTCLSRIFIACGVDKSRLYMLIHLIAFFQETFFSPTREQPLFLPSTRQAYHLPQKY